MDVAYSLLPSPVDTLLLAGGPGVLRGLWVAGHDHAPDPEAGGWVEDDGALAGPRRQLEEYFAGERTRFELRVEPLGGSAWDRTVWAALSAIPFGETLSYGQLAGRLGRPGAARAVGGANGRNPVSIVLPCHRVLAAGGALGGYGWGLDRKRWLLAHERSVRAGDGPLAASAQLPLG